MRSSETTVRPRAADPAPPRTDPSAQRDPHADGRARSATPWRGSVLLLLGGLTFTAVLWGLLDPPPTWHCASPSPSRLAELNAQRAEFLRHAVPLAVPGSTLLAAWARQWAADRRARQGYARRPGRLARFATIVLGPLWILLVGQAALAGNAGPAILVGFLLTTAGLALAIVTAVGVAFLGLFDARTRPRSAEAFDSLLVGAVWSALLFALPLLLVLAAAAGRQATIWC
jgi:hypothetical protein